MFPAPSNDARYHNRETIIQMSGPSAPNTAAFGNFIAAAPGPLPQNMPNAAAQNQPNGVAAIAQKPQGTTPE